MKIIKKLIKKTKIVTNKITSSKLVKTLIDFKKHNVGKISYESIFNLDHQPLN
jgi:hypothetical protein